MKWLAILIVSAGCAFGQAASRPASYKDLKFKPLPPLKLPEVKTITLSNGMKVFLLENHELPLVRGFARIRVGNVFDPPEKAGLSDVFGEVLRVGGAGSRNGDEINEMLEGMAASIESSVGESSGNLSFNTLRENVDTVLELFRDILTDPKFSEEKLEIEKNQYRSVIARRNDNPQSIAGREYMRLLYGPDTPYGRQMEYETLDRIQRDDLVAFYKRYYFPANIMLGIYGDFSSAEMQQKLEKLFADWKVTQPPVPEFPPLTYQPKPGVYLAAKSDVNQTAFYLGHLGGKFSDKDYPALDVMTDILGAGQFSSRLVQKVRSDLGLAYHVGASWSARYNMPGTFTISGGTKSESTVEALKAIREEVDRIRTTEVSDEELQIAKESTLNAFVFAFDSSGEILNRIVTYEYWGYPKDFIFQYQKAVAAVTKADVLRVAKEHIHPDRFVLVAVGNPQQFGTPLTALGMPVHNLDITIPEPKREDAAESAESLERGKAMLQAFQAKVGGAGKIAAIKDYQHTADVKILSVPGGLAVKQTSSLLGHEVRLEQVLPFGKVIIYYDGKGGGWMSSPQGSGPLPAPAVKQVQGELFRNPLSLWLSDREDGRKINAIGPNTIEISDAQGHWVRLQFDSDGLIEKAVYPSDQGGGESEATYGNWTAVNGLQLPHSLKIAQGGKPAAEITITEIRLNSGLKSEELAKQP